MASLCARLRVKHVLALAAVLLLLSLALLLFSSHQPDDTQPPPAAKAAPGDAAELQLQLQQQQQPGDDGGSEPLLAATGAAASHDERSIQAMQQLVEQLQASDRQRKALERRVQELELELVVATAASRQQPPPPPPQQLPPPIARSTAAAPSCKNASGDPIGAVTSSADPWLRSPDAVLPNVVRVWRSAALDWHMLLRQPRLPPDPRAALELRLLVEQEDAVTRFFTSGNSGPRAPGLRDYGPLRKASLCTRFSDSCVLHESEAACVRDELCAWAERERLCLGHWSEVLEHLDAVRLQRFFPLRSKHYRFASRDERSAAIASPAGLLPPDAASRLGTSEVHVVKPGVAAGTRQLVSQVGLDGCRVLVEAPAFDLSLNMEKMYFHFVVDNFQMLHTRMATADALDQRNGHILIKNTFYYDLYFEWFGILSDVCARDIADLPLGTCFTHLNPPMNQKLALGISPVSFLGLGDVPRPSEPVFGILSRQNKRFILNEHELAQHIESMGFKVLLLPLEDMTAYEQLRALRSINILVGIHGSGLTNVKWMHPRCVVLQIVPHIVTYGTDAFVKMTERHGCTYLEWRNPHRDLATFHYHFVDDEFQGREHQVVPEQLGTMSMARTFWFNQDTYIPLEDATEFINGAVEALRAYGAE